MLQSVINFITMPIVWIPVVALLIFLTYRNYKKYNKIKVLNMDSVLLTIEVAKNNDKKELAAEQFFASLRGILRDAKELKNTGGIQEHLSFEIASTNNQIRFFIWVPRVYQAFVTNQIYAQYPSVQIHAVDQDYVDNRANHPVAYSAEVTLTDDSALPIRTFDTFDVDPLASITGALSQLDKSKNEELWIQILTRPISDEWHNTVTKSFVDQIKSGKKPFSFKNLFTSGYFPQIFSALWRPPESTEGGASGGPEISDRDKTRIAKAEEKATKLGYEVKIRLAYLGPDELSAKTHMQTLGGTFNQFNTNNLNGFKLTKDSFDPAMLNLYKSRNFDDPGFILNTAELASVFHLPHTSVETPNIVWTVTKTAEPPAKLPILTGNAEIDANISAFGVTNFRNVKHQFGLYRHDRSRHIYVIGQTGAGKSGLLELLALSDIYHNQGYCIIDPHGDFAINNLKYVPESRIDDVIYFNPSDIDHPVAFNPLEVTDNTLKANIASDVVTVLKRMFGDSWGPRMEHILRYTLLALLDRPDTTLLDIQRMLSNKDFRKETLEYCKDTTVLQFWKHEFGAWSEKYATEAIAPVLNKVGAFTANPIIRNIIGQAKSSFNIREIMDQGKILIVNLSKGLVGEDNAGILGAFLVTKIQLAAMSRSDITNIEDRRPFYLYVDEFQNFATDSFASILSEARKYGLNLTVANQYVAQMTETVRNAVFGNVGTTISFRVSADDAPFLAKQFEPVFDTPDLLKIANRDFFISMIIGGEKHPAFSGRTLNLPKAPFDHTKTIIERSRASYSRPSAIVEKEIDDIINAAEQYLKDLKAQGQNSAPKEEVYVPMEKKKGFFARRAERTSSDSDRTRATRPASQTTTSRPETHPKRKNTTTKSFSKPQNPKLEFKKLNISPSEAESGQKPAGLKDIAKLINEKKTSGTKESDKPNDKTSGKSSPKPPAQTGELKIQR